MSCVEGIRLFPKPAGQTLVKVTGIDDTAAISARIRGISAVLRAA